LSGPTGLEAIELIVRESPAYLAAGGWLVLEHGWKQAGAVRDRACAQPGFTNVDARDADLAGHETRVAEGSHAGI